MPVQRRRFRIEEAFAGDLPMPAAIDGDAGPMHHEIMSELRALRAQMAGTGRSVATETVDASVLRETAEAHALLETYRAQIGQCEKLKVELDLIHDAINRTKREIAVLHGTSFNGEEMAKVNGELGAVVGGTEEATQQILEAAESIDQAATALSKVTSPDQQKILSEEIQERVVSIFEACLQFPGSDRSAHQQGDDHDEIHRKPHHRHDGHLGWRRCHQGARAADRRYEGRRCKAAERPEGGGRRRPRLAGRHRRVV